MLTADARNAPETAAERSAVVVWLRRAMAEELTDKQRMAIEAVVLGGMPLEEVASRLGTNRNALYKLIHDARLRLKRRLAREGMTVQEMLDSLGGR